MLDIESPFCVTSRNLTNRNIQDLGVSGTAENTLESLINVEALLNKGSISGRSLSSSRVDRTGRIHEPNLAVYGYLIWRSLPFEILTCSFESSIYILRGLARVFPVCLGG